MNNSNGFDKNTVIGLLLIGILVVVFSLYNQPSPEELKRQEALRDSIEQVANQANQIVIDSTNKNVKHEQSLSSSTPLASNKENIIDTTKNQLFKQNFNEDELFTTIENELLKVRFTNKGGRVYSVELKDYKTYEQTALILFDGNTNIFDLNFLAKNKGNSQPYNTQNLNFKLVKNEVSNNDKIISYRLIIEKEKYIEYVYSLTPNSYLLDFSINIVGLEDIIPINNNYFNLNWTTDIIKQEKSLENERKKTTIYYKYKGDEVDNLSENEASVQENLSTTVDWIAYKQKFFNATLIADNGFEEGKLELNMDESSEVVKRLSSSLVIPYSNQVTETIPLHFYFGPNHYKNLKKLNIDLDKIVYLGWGIFSWVNKFLIIPVFDFLNQYISNYGLIILLLTIFIKLLLFFFTYKSYLSTAKMKLIQPEINELKKKYGNDQQKISTEQMKLFRSAGVNPLGGCIPMVLQMPFLIAMFSFFPSSIELRQQSFLWATDLSTYDSIYDLPFSLPFYGDHVSLFTLLMTISTVIYSSMNSQMTAGGNAAQMKMMQYIMPVMFLPMFNSFPAALTYYYFLANIITFAQQFFIKKFIVSEDMIRKQMEERKKKPQKKSGFQKRLEDMARKQEEARRNRKR